MLYSNFVRLPILCDRNRKPDEKLGPITTGLVIDSQLPKLQAVPTFLLYNLPLSDISFQCLYE